MEHAVASGITSDIHSNPLNLELSKHRKECPSHSHCLHCERDGKPCISIKACHFVWQKFVLKADLPKIFTRHHETIDLMSTKTTFVDLVSGPHFNFPPGLLAGAATCSVGFVKCFL